MSIASRVAGPESDPAFYLVGNGLSEVSGPFSVFASEAKPLPELVIRRQVNTGEFSIPAGAVDMLDALMDELPSEVSRVSANHYLTPGLRLLQPNTPDQQIYIEGSALHLGSVRCELTRRGLECSHNDILAVIGFLLSLGVALEEIGIPYHELREEHLIFTKEGIKLLNPTFDAQYLRTLFNKIVIKKWKYGCSVENTNFSGKPGNSNDLSDMFETFIDDIWIIILGLVFPSETKNLRLYNRKINFDGVKLLLERQSPRSEFNQIINLLKHCLLEQKYNSFRILDASINSRFPEAHETILMMLSNHPFIPYIKPNYDFPSPANTCRVELQFRPKSYREMIEELSFSRAPVDVETHKYWMGSRALPRKDSEFTSDPLESLSHRILTSIRPDTRQPAVIGKFDQGIPITRGSLQKRWIRKPPEPETPVSEHRGNSTPMEHTIGPMRLIFSRRLSPPQSRGLCEPKV